MGATAIIVLALWSVVFPLGMYSVATLSFSKVAHLSFMEPLSRFMLWVALAAWVAVAATFVARIRGRERLTKHPFSASRLPTPSFKIRAARFPGR